MSLLKHTSEDKALSKILKGQDPDRKTQVGWSSALEEKNVEQNTEEKERKERIAKILQGARMPLWCPACEHPMKHRLDRKFWTLHQKCFDCVIKEQTKMRAEGTWDAYEQQRLNANRLHYLMDLEQFLVEAWTSIKNPEFATEVGTIERWGGLDIAVVKEDIHKELEEVRKILREIQDGTANTDSQG